MRALDEWLERAGIADGPIFRSIGKGDRLTTKRLLPGAVAEIIKRRFEAAGLDPDDYAGHSLRSGFITAALEHGADVFAAADHARHKKLETTRGYDQRRKLFANPAGKGFL